MRRLGREGCCCMPNIAVREASIVLVLGTLGILRSPCWKIPHLACDFSGLPDKVKGCLVKFYFRYVMSTFLVSVWPMQYVG